LVCLSSAPSNPKIIQTAACMAAAFQGQFTAVFVETPDFSVETEENRHGFEKIKSWQSNQARISRLYLAKMWHIRLQNSPDSPG